MTYKRGDIPGIPAGRKTARIVFDPQYTKSTAKIISYFSAGYAVSMSSVLLVLDNVPDLAVLGWSSFLAALVIFPGIIWARSRRSFIHAPSGYGRVEETLIQAAYLICRLEDGRSITDTERRELWSIYLEAVSCLASNVSEESHELRDSEVDFLLTSLADRFQIYTERPALSHR